MCAQEPPQQLPSVPETRRDRKAGLGKTEIGGTAGEAIKLTLRAELDEFPTIVIAAQIVRAIHARAKHFRGASSEVNSGISEGRGGVSEVRVGVSEFK